MSTKAEKAAKGELASDVKVLSDVAKVDGEVLTVGQHVYIGNMPDFANDAERVAFRRKYTFEVEFDFANVTEREKLLQLVSQTTYRKMWYNNEVRPNTAKGQGHGQNSLVK